MRDAVDGAPAYEEAVERAAVLAQAAARGRAVRRAADAPRFPALIFVQEEEPPSPGPPTVSIPEGEMADAPSPALWPEAAKASSSPAAVARGQVIVPAEPDPPSPAARKPGGGGGRAGGGGGTGGRNVRCSVERPSALPLLDWSHRELDARGLEGLASALLESSATSLWLHDNGLGPDGAAALGRELQAAPDARVARLMLSNNNLGEAGLRRMLQACPAALPRLVALSLGVNRIGADGAALLATAAAGGPLSSLRELMLGGNPIGPAGGGALAEALRGGQSELAILQLGRCELRDEGGVALARAMASGGCPRLSILHLNDNQLGAATAGELSAAICSDKCGLTELWLGGNLLTPDGAAAVAGALSGAVGLRRLWLDHTGADITVVRALASALSSCGLEELGLGGNALTDDAADALAVHFGQVTSLRKLWLNETGLSAIGCGRLLEAALLPGCAVIQLWLPAARLGLEERRQLAEAADRGNQRRARDDPRSELRLKLA